ncbi:MAG TPA: ABC transporter ATP-binding protein [Stellaceae bacterium]|nr:ABC transporter ATP-binding protein [Stellaceae bacterium]
MSHDLELIRVGKTYDNGTLAVSEFDLEVARGEFIAFVGPSGCGKTTTLRMIAGFETITTGEVRIRGRRVNELPPERRPTSTIFQNFALFPHLTVRRNVEYGLAVKGVKGAERRRKVDDILGKLGLSDIAERRPEGLSGGQRQRVALARSLVVEPEILLLDEPLGALDANLRKSIQHELKLLQRNLGITFIFVTHAQAEALVLSDRMIVMNRGRVEQISRPYELYTRPRTGFVARFIGRNTILPGRLKETSGEIAGVETALGTFQGSLHGARLGAGASVELVIPSEALDVDLGENDQRARYGGNWLAGEVTSREVVGHTVYFAIRLADGSVLSVESHVGKYEGVSRSSKAHIGWAAAEATVIAQGQ